MGENVSVAVIGERVWNMHDHEGAMVTFAKLAAVSHDRQQLTQRDKFLLLAGAAAIRGNCVDVAARCRQLVLLNNPQHMIGGFDSFALALADTDYQTFHRQLQRFCSYEQGEHFLEQQGLDSGAPATGAMTRSHYALLLLSRVQTESDS